MSPRRNLTAAATLLVVAVLLVATDPARVSAATPPANDSRAAATVVSALPFSESVDVSGATRQKSDPGACYNDILARWARTMYRTVWYRVPAPGFDTLIVSVTASAGRPVIAVGREIGGRLLGDCQYTGRSDATGLHELRRSDERSAGRGRSRRRRPGDPRHRDPERRTARPDERCLAGRDPDRADALRRSGGHDRCPPAVPTTRPGAAPANTRSGTGSDRLTRSVSRSRRWGAHRASRSSVGSPGHSSRCAASYRARRRPTSSGPSPAA